jgi:hypothetical protein
MTALTDEQAANQLGFDATDRYWELLHAVEVVNAEPTRGLVPGWTPEENIAYWTRLLDEFREEHRGKWLIDRQGEPIQV